MTYFRKILTAILWLSMAGLFGFALIFSASVLYISPNLPTVDSLKDITLQTPLKIYTTDGKLIAQYGEKRREPLYIGQVPDLLIKALLAAEDQNFYHHHGVDPKGLLRAVYELATTGHIHSGGSTITMQVARNFFLSNKQTFSRKFNEILLAIKMERELSKQDILELYINKIYLGNRAYGFGAAAKIYYSKELAQLDLAELAMIAGLPKAPSRFNPIVDPQRALERRNWILQRMHILGFVNEQQYQQAAAEALNIHPQITQQDPETLYIAEMARQDVVNRFGPQVYDAGYSVVVTIDSTLQAAANRAVMQGLLAYDQRHGYRGAEAKIPLPTEESPEIYWPAKLAPFVPVNELMPGVVTSIAPTQATVLLKDGSQTELTLAQIKWARKYISATQMGPTPKKITDVLAVGDVIRVQAAAEAANVWKLSQLPIVEGALIAIDPDNGAIKSLVGGFSYDRSNFNRVTQASRQVGSSIKPFIYSAALAKGYTAASIINDAPLVFESEGDNQQAWRPENATGTFLGPIRLRKALYESRNLVSIRLLNQMGVQDTIDFLAQLGFDVSRFPKDLSLALGSVDLTPMTVASAFTLFANGGYKVEPYLVESISDTQGHIVYQASPVKVCHTCVEAPPPEQQPQQATTDEDPYMLDPSSTESNKAVAAAPTPPPAPTTTDTTKNAPRVMDAKIAYIMRSMLQDVIARGTGIDARVLGRKDVGGKTGTTNDQKDAWFTGFNANLVTSVWVGFDTPSELGAGEYGARAALPIWVDYMKVALKGKPDNKYIPPAGIVTVRIDPISGLRAASGQKGAIAEIFDANHLPATATPAANPAAPDGEEDGTAAPPPPPIDQLF